MTFQPPSVVPSLATEPNRVLVKAFQDISTDLTAIAEGLAENTTPVQTGNYQAQLGDLVRAIPPATGLTVTLPQSSSANAGEHVRIAVESVASTGSVTVVVVAGQLINGAATLALSSVGLTDCQSTGTGWTAAVGSGGGTGGGFTLQQIRRFLNYRIGP